MTDINELVALLGADKAALLDKIENNVKERVSKLGKKCLDVYQITPGGTYNYYAALPPSLGWAARFVSFCRESSYEGRVVDSVIPDVVNGAVTDAFLEYYESKGEEIAAIVSIQLATSDAFIDALSRCVADSKLIDGVVATARYSVNEKIKLALAESLRTTVSKSAIAKSTAVASAVVTKVASSSIGPLVVKQLAILSKGIVAKIMASSAFKVMVAAMIKKFAAAIIITIVTHFLWTLVGAKVAAAIGGSIFPIITVAILGWIAYELASLPTTLGNKIGMELKYKLKGEIDKINEQVAIDIHAQIGTNLGALAASIVADTSFIKECSSIFSDT